MEPMFTERRRRTEYLLVPEALAVFLSHLVLESDCQSGQIPVQNIGYLPNETGVTNISEFRLLLFFEALRL